MQNPFSAGSYVALIDSTSGAMLTIGTRISSMVFLKECIPNTSWITEVPYPSLETYFGLYFMTPILSEEYPEWSWDRKNSKFARTRMELLNDELLATSRLAESKRSVFEKIVAHVSRARFEVISGAQFQEMVYIAKKMQAKAFKDSGYDEGLILECPYVVQYADFAHISLRQAADDILLKASFDDDILYKTELLRLRYVNKVKMATDPAEMPSIYGDFLRESYINAVV